MTSSWVCRFAEYFREHKAQLPIHVWRDASPQHFNTPTGDFKCDNCPDAPYPFVCEVRPVPSYCTHKRCLWLLGCSQQPPQPCRAAGLVCCSLQAGGSPQHTQQCMVLAYRSAHAPCMPCQSMPHGAAVLCPLPSRSPPALPAHPHAAQPLSPTGHPAMPALHPNEHTTLHRPQKGLALPCFS